MEDIINLQGQDFSFFGKQSKIIGEFNLVGPTRISADLQGELVMSDTSLLSIERAGSFTGNINCYNIDIYGEINGSLIAKGKVTIYPSAKVTGEIQAQNLIIHPGSTINITGHTESENS